MTDLLTTKEQRAEWAHLVSKHFHGGLADEALPALINDVETLAAENARLKAFAVWASSGDTGLSSECLARHMLGLDANSKYYGARHPLDVGDFGRCYRLLEAVPAWKARIGEMGVYSREWAALAKSWADISEAYASGNNDRAYELIRRARQALGGDHD